MEPPWINNKWKKLTYYKAFTGLGIPFLILFLCNVWQTPGKSLFNISTAVVWQSRRTTYISAEQKRRSNIKIGFKTLCNLVPTLKSQSNVSLCLHKPSTIDSSVIEHRYLVIFVHNICFTYSLNINLYPPFHLIHKLCAFRSVMQSHCRRQLNTLENSSRRGNRCKKRSRDYERR